MLVHTAAPDMTHDFFKIAILRWGEYKVYYRREFYTRDHENNYCELENCLLLICIQFELICGTFLRYKQIYGEKLPLVKIRENKLFRHRPEAIGRPVIHTHHIYMNEHIFFWMLRAQIIRICNVEMKITPSSGAFSKWLSRRKCRKTKIEISVSPHLIITDIHNLSLDICFWGWKIWRD